MDRDVIHVLPQDYIIDDQDGIREPLGMSGVRLEAKVHIVTGAATSAQNIVKCCNRTGLNVAEIVLAPLAAAEAVLTDEERELGVVLIDVGGGTTDIAIYHDGAVKHTAVIGLGGNHVTNDIAAGLRTPFNDAERIKQRHGCARASMVNDDETVEVPSVAGKGAEQRLARRFSARSSSRASTRSSSWCERKSPSPASKALLTSGIVITGGSMLLPGAVEMAERSFGLPVRLGRAARTCAGSSISSATRSTPPAWVWCCTA